MCIYTTSNKYKKFLRFCNTIIIFHLALIFMDLTEHVVVKEPDSIEFQWSHTLCMYVKRFKTAATFETISLLRKNNLFHPKTFSLFFSLFFSLSLSISVFLSLSFSSFFLFLSFSSLLRNSSRFYRYMFN